MTDVVSSHRGLPIRERVKPGRVRRVMAHSMHESVQRSALSQIAREIDLTEVQAIRRKSLEDNRLSLNVYLLAAVARVLPEHPLLNAEFVEDEILVFDQVNLGLAIAVQDGLVVAVIRDADRKSLHELSSISQDLAARARDGKLTYADIEGGTFTLSNLGMYGIDTAFPLPRPPEGAILLVGRTRPRAEVIDGKIEIREVAWFSLTYDHRFIDGATGAKYLQDLQTKFSKPEAFVNES